MQAHRAPAVATFKRYRLYEQGEAAREDARLDPIRLASLDVPQVALGNPSSRAADLIVSPRRSRILRQRVATGWNRMPSRGWFASLIREPRSRSCRRRAQGRRERRLIRRDELLAP